jgi:hypothetical protein
VSTEDVTVSNVEPSLLFHVVALHGAETTGALLVNGLLVRVHPGVMERDAPHEGGIEALAASCPPCTPRASFHQQHKP